MKRFLLWASLACAFVIFVSCEKKQELELGSIYGIVTDLATGNPVQSANVQLQPTGETTQTGSDGAYEFLDVEDGRYTLKVTKVGYSDLLDDHVISVKNGRQVKRDVQIEKLTPKLTVVDDDENDVTALDFGDNPADVIRSFFIFNKGEEKLEWSIEYECAWISFNQTKGELKPNDSQPLKLTIDRTKLNSGINSTTVHILSNGGTKQIKVSATKANAIETLPASGEQAHSVVLHGRIIQDLSPSITECGFVYNKKGAPSIENGATIVKMPSLPSIGATYNALVSDLEIQTWYYARAYATNGTMTVYGDDIRFLTEEGKPDVETTGYSNLTSSSVIIQCKVKNDGGYELTERGVCYGLSPEPQVDGLHIIDGGKGVGPYECPLTELLPNQHYYVRAYAKNEYRISYGEQIEFDTNDGMAKLSIGQVTSITSYSAVCPAQVESDGGRQVTERGICWSTRQNPTINDYKKADGLTGTGSFTCTMDNLQPGTTYYVKAYAVNSAGISYSHDERNFTTTFNKPTVSTQGANNVTSSSATVSGNISSTGGASITEAGFKYQADGEYSWTSKQVQVTSGTFSCQLTNLTPGTKYYVYAYAKNAQGIGEGSIINFTTASGLPQVSTVSSSNVGSTRATVTGKIVSNGGFSITECAICYSKTNSKPSLSDNVVYATPTQSGQFSCELTNLEPSTKYYARAYAKNMNGPAYDNTSINFKTSNGTPAVTIAQQPTYNGSTATVYGRITSDGGANITNYGVVYSTVNSNPSIDSYQAVQMEEGAPITNDFTFTVTNVPSGTMIYYRFFVVNSLEKIAYSSSGYLLNY